MVKVSRFVLMDILYLIPPNKYILRKNCASILPILGEFSSKRRLNKYSHNSISQLPHHYEINCIWQADGLTDKHLLAVSPRNVSSNPLLLEVLMNMGLYGWSKDYLWVESRPMSIVTKWNRCNKKSGWELWQWENGPQIKQKLNQIISSSNTNKTINTVAK